MSVGVAIVAHSVSGGSGVVARDLAHLLAAEGHRVRVLSPPEPECAHEEVQRDKEARYAPIGDADLGWVDVVAPAYPVFDHAPSDLAMASAIARTVDEDDLGVVHVHYAVPWAVSAALARRLAARPFRLVVTLHGTDVSVLARDPAYRAPLAWALAEADALLVPSRSLRDEVEEVFGAELAARVRVVRNWVDPDRFTPASDAERGGLRRALARELCEADVSHVEDRGDPAHACPAEPLRRAGGPSRWLVHVSNYRPVKQTRLLADVFARVSADAEVGLLLVGAGPEREPLVADLAARGLSDRVVCTGHVPHPGPWVRAADAFVLPSAHESFGLAALEAMSSGVPVVAFRVGGLAELVGAGEGVLVPNGDVEAMAQACTRLLSDRAHRLALAGASVRCARARYSPQRALAEHLHVYAQEHSP